MKVAITAVSTAGKRYSIIYCPSEQLMTLPLELDASSAHLWGGEREPMDH